MKLFKQIGSIYSRMSFGICLLALNTGCTNAKLSLSQQAIQGATSKGMYCSQYGRNSSSPLKVLFVVDMSMSNLGAFNSAGKFDGTTGTDPKGLRFQAIQNFVKDCGGTNTEYAITSFSNEVVSVDGSATCNIGFGDGVALGKTIQGLEAIQAYDLNFYSKYTSGGLDPRVRMRETAYLRGIDCLKKIVQSDLVENSAKHPYYHVFFVTDGKPTQDGTCNTNPSCYSNTIEPFVAQISGSQSAIKIQPIYYGGAAEKTQALQILNPIAQAGGVDQTLVVDQLKSDALCNSVAKPVGVRFRKSVMFTMNLNAKMVNNRLKVDSDADGIPDDEEAALGFDPLNSHTFGILDSICRTHGGAEACKKLSGTLLCQNISNNLGLTDCDIAFLKLTDVDTVSVDKGIDTDGDGIPDFLEMLRDTLPTVSDGNQDLDGDSMSNQLEVAQGSQTNFPDPQLAEILKVSTRESLILGASQCPVQSEAWEYELLNVPTIPATAYEDSRKCATGQDASRKCLKFSHAANENIILIVFKSVPENDPGGQAEVWGSTYKVLTGRTNQSIAVQPQDFFLLGRVRQ